MTTRLPPISRSSGASSPAFHGANAWNEFLAEPPRDFEPIKSTFDISVFGDRTWFMTEFEVHGDDIERKHEVGRLGLCRYLPPSARGDVGTGPRWASSSMQSAVGPVREKRMRTHPWLGVGPWGRDTQDPEALFEALRTEAPNLSALHMVRSVPQAVVFDCFFAVDFRRADEQIEEEEGAAAAPHEKESEALGY